MKVEDKCIEDALIVDAEEKPLAVVEIKGVVGNFKRENIGQVDAHRERLGLTPDIPGLLIVNTMMSVGNLAEKDVKPHPDIVKKAVTDNVLLIRTLDLLRIVNLIETELTTPKAVEKFLFSGGGSLIVEDDKIKVER